MSNYPENPGEVSSQMDDSSDPMDDIEDTPEPNFAEFYLKLRAGVGISKSELDYAKTNPQWAYNYAREVIKGRWPEGEEAISKDPYWAYSYAVDVVGGRWPEGEKTISKDPEWAFYYAREVIKGRWPEGEEAIKKRPIL